MLYFNHNIKSPLNYTGNKFRILEQIKPHFPKHIDTMVDLFCGGATVGLNTPCKKVIFIDNNPYVINLLKTLSEFNFESLLEHLEKLIEHYQLSYSAQKTYSFYSAKIEGNRNNGLKNYNANGFYQLRNDYNTLPDKTTENANLLLYLLIVYGFNNDIRFSNKLKFNLPAGKTDLNRNNIKKLYEYINRVKQLDAKFICGDFRTPSINDIIFNADFVYMDPPYLITDAVYNESNKWNVNLEICLLNLIDKLYANNIKFALSNVISKGEQKTNIPLSNWYERNKQHLEIIDIDYHYRGAYYNKRERGGEREILIIPKY